MCPVRERRAIRCFTDADGLTCSLSYRNFAPAKYPVPICGRPPACKRVAVVHRIACDHMSGLLSRSHMTAAKMVSATRVPNRAAAWDATGYRGVSRVLGSIDHTDCSVSSKLPALPTGRLPTCQRRGLWLPHCRGCVACRRCCGEGGAEREAFSERSAPLRPRPCCTAMVIALATDHQFPDDARGLVGERHGGQLRRLARRSFLRSTGRSAASTPCN